MNSNITRSPGRRKGYVAVRYVVVLAYGCPAQGILISLTKFSPSLNFYAFIVFLFLLLY